MNCIKQTKEKTASRAVKRNIYIEIKGDKEPLERSLAKIREFAQSNLLCQ